MVCDVSSDLWELDAESNPPVTQTQGMPDSQQMVLATKNQYPILGMG